MGVISGLVDIVVVLFSGVLALAVPLIDAQALFAAGLYPAPLVELKRWYAEEYGDYLVQEEPRFFTGLIWMEVIFLWPLSLANIYGILARRPWAATTSLMAGVSTATAMAAVMAELLGSGRASDKLLQMYVPFVLFALFAILKGLFYRSQRSSTTASHGPSARKKRV